MLPVNRTKHPNCRYFLGPPGLQQLAMLRQGEQNLTEHTVPVFWPGPSAPSEPTEVRASSSSPGGLQPSIFLLLLLLLLLLLSGTTARCVRAAIPT